MTPISWFLACRTCATRFDGIRCASCPACNDTNAGRTARLSLEELHSAYQRLWAAYHYARQSRHAWLWGDFERAATARTDAAQITSQLADVNLCLRAA